MKCCAIKLASRAEERGVDFQKPRHRCHPAILETDDDDYARFSSETRSEAMEDDGPFLSIQTISLPANIRAFNTGSSIKRWASKRPRLRSARKQRRTKEANAFDPDPDPDNLDVSNLIKELQNDSDNDPETELENTRTEEIHPDIVRLLSASTENKTGNETLTDSKRISFDLDDSNERTAPEDGAKKKSKRRHKKKAKDGSKDKDKGKGKKKLTKTVSFSISKPPTPQTEQVIRVDVISNYSVEFPVETQRTDGMSSEQGRNSEEKLEKEMKKQGEVLFQVFCTEKAEEKKEFVVESKKAVLFPR